MLFNSWEFWIFFAAVFGLYSILPNVRSQNIMLLIASYYFYGMWNWHFLSLIALSTLVDFVLGLAIYKSDSPRNRRLYLSISLLANLGLLGFFKYFNFFISSAESLFSSLGVVSPHYYHLDIILPVGISFYTFQSLSYTIDIYRRELEPTTDILNFALFVSFFPQLVAGPIERAALLLPQVENARRVYLEKYQTGTWLICWGLFKKVAIADNLSRLADPVFTNSSSTTAAACYLATTAFAFQIYCDFSGYTDIARGLARLLGFELMRNFNLPYFAMNPSDFWKRWHISLSTWLRDYLYIPLGGNRGSRLRTYWNLMLTMLIGGLWHGASWNFIWWGLFHGLILVGYHIIRIDHVSYRAPSYGLTNTLSRLTMYHFTLFGWLIFRCTRRLMVNGVPVDDSASQLRELLLSFQNGWGLTADASILAVSILILLTPLLLVQLLQYRTGDLYCILNLPLFSRSCVYAALFVFFIFHSTQGTNAFIYFQF